MRAPTLWLFALCLLCPFTGLAKSSGSAAKAVTLPVERTAMGHLVISAIAGERTLTLLLDTGAPQSVLDQNVVPRNQQVANPAPAALVAVGAQILPGQSAEMDLRFGALLAGKCPVQLTDLSALRQALREAGFEEFDGIAGADFLRRHRAVLDLEKMTLRLRTPAS